MAGLSWVGWVDLFSGLGKGGKERRERGFVRSLFPLKDKGRKGERERKE